MTAGWEGYRLSGRPTLPQKTREGWGNRPWGDSSDFAQDKFFSRKEHAGDEHPVVLSTASTVQAVVRSFGALGALLRMTRIERGEH